MKNKRTRIQISLIGPNTSGCSKEIYELGLSLGEELAKRDVILFNGGMGGFMEAVAKGKQRIKNNPCSKVIGILPSDNIDNGNEWLDVVIPSGIGIARNILLINSADLVIACSGGAGTLSEIAFAWQKNKPVLCLSSYGGWSQELAGTNLDQRRSGLLIEVKTLDEVLTYVDNFLKVSCNQP